MEDKCRVCGCTWDNACVTDQGACWWVEEDLCSACANKSQSGISDKERWEQIKARYKDSLEVAEYAGVTLTAEDYSFLIQRVEELDRDLNGTKHKYGYKQMYGLCNRDFASLNYEKERYKQALESASSELHYALYSNKSDDVKKHYVTNAKHDIDEVLKGES